MNIIIMYLKLPHHALHLNVLYISNNACMLKTLLSFKFLTKKNFFSGLPEELVTVEEGLQGNPDQG